MRLARCNWISGMVLAIGLTCGVAGTALGAGPVSAARVWDEQLLAAIRLDKPRPPVHARNLYHVSAGMWDAWAAFDAQADQVFHNERMTATNVEAARAEAISYVAYRLIAHRYQSAFGSTTTLAALRAQMIALGYDPDNTDTFANTPAALGNRIFTTIRDACMLDGANETNNYAASLYFPSNQPLIIALSGTTMIDPNRWQPLAFSYFVNQNGIPEGAIVQTFVCPHWANVRTFGITRPNAFNPYFDPGPPPMLGTSTDAQFKSDFTQVIRYSSYMDPTTGVTMDISPATFHNNPLGTSSGTGYGSNPVTGQTYPPNIVNRADYVRCISEFWADGPNSETPPGHWNVLANKVSDDPTMTYRVGGTGSPVNRLEWDVKLYLALNGAVHDAAVTCWGIKGKYDSSRPISAIRYCGQSGQSSDPLGPSYHPQGLPLVPGLVEVVTAASSAAGQRHAHLAANIGEVAILAWKGQPASPSTQIGGVDWILAKNWMPYQASTFVTPPFAAYTSGHSTFSRSAAEVLTAFTGSPYFPGGLGTYTFPANSYLSFERGPSQTLQLQWAAYYDAADEAGISRLYGGIHIPADDFTGRVIGSSVGKIAFGKATKFYDGRIRCPGDFNTNGVTDVPDIFAFLGQWFTGNLRADVDGDAQVAVPDIFAFLTSWFAGCP